MVEAIAQPNAQPAVVSSIIPKGREDDYWELSAPSGDTYSLDMVIDKANMYVAPLLITNGSEDRDGEVTNPDGLIEAAYKRNPVIFLQHSHRIAPMAPPVGTAVTPQRVYDVHRRPDGWYSGCRFTQAIKFASQVFRLVDDEVLRGRSIGALNHRLSNYKPRLPGVTFHNGQIVPVRTKSISHDSYELIEWSWVWMPSNRDVVTPARSGITPAREVVPIIKSILSHNRLDGLPLDPKLSLIMKSLNLAEPASNLQGAGKVRFWPFASNTGVANVSSPFAVLFSQKSFNVAQAAQFLRSSADLGLIETQLQHHAEAGTQFLKSVQYAYNGPTERLEDADSGVVLLFAKAAPEGVVTEVADQVDIAAAQQPAGAAVKPAAEDAVIVTEKQDDAEMAKMQPGLRYLKALIKKASEVADEAEAAMLEQEPEMIEKCQQYTQKLRGFIKEVADFETERYGQKPVEQEEEKPQTAALEKSLLVDLFYDRRVVLPQVFTKGLQLLHADAPTGKHKQLAAAMLKGVVGTEEQQEDLLRQQMRGQIVKRLAERAVEGITS